MWCMKIQVCLQKDGYDASGEIKVTSVGVRERNDIRGKQKGEWLRIGEVCCEIWIRSIGDATRLVIRKYDSILNEMKWPDKMDNVC